MAPEALLSLVVFTGVVSVYRLGKTGASVAEVFPGGDTLPQKASVFACIYSIALLLVVFLHRCCCCCCCC